jgi:hypothetical protein
VEHPFRVIKRQFGLIKVRFRGLQKNTAIFKSDPDPEFFEVLSLLFVQTARVCELFRPSLIMIGVRP